MGALLQWLSVLVARRPLPVLVVLGVLTLVFGAFATQTKFSGELTEFAPESDVQAAFQRVQEDFAGESLSVVVIVEATDGGSVLSSEGLSAAAQIESAVSSVPLPVDEAAPPPNGQGADGGARPPGTALTSFAQPFLAAGIDPASADEAQIEQVVAEVAQAQPQVAMLLSRDFDPEDAEASAGLVVVPLGLRLSLAAGGGAADQEEIQRAIDLSRQVAEAAETGEGGGINVIPFNEALLIEELEAGVTDELPLLLGASLTLVLGILVFTFRSVSDVVIGIAGLALALVWTFGISALLGPGYLGVVGPFSQMATAVPVLIVGLGIDYAIHLTSRYREEQASGAPPEASASRAVTTVGAALALATVTVLVGFLTNLFSPLPPLRDFGVFVAAGVLAAFVIFLLGVPAARRLLDSRRGRRAPEDQGEGPSGSSGGFSTLTGRLAVLSERHPLAVVLVTVTITVLAAVAATQVGTTFQITDFIPEDSQAGQAIASLDEHFGGDLTERSYVFVEGDMTDPDVANAMLEVERQLEDLPFVQTAGGSVQSVSPASLAAQVAMSAPGDAAAGWTGEGFAPDAEMEALYARVEQRAPGQLAAVLSDGRQAGLIIIPTVASQENAEAFADALRPRVEPIAEAGASATITSENLVLQEALDALTASQTQGIAITLAAALLLLITYYTLADRRPLLGLATMLPSLLVTVWTLGTMWVLGLSFNVLTVMVSALAIGIGVPYGIHVTNRFMEEIRTQPSVDDAITRTMRGTGAALTGSAATTAAGFGVLMLSSLAPLRQFGLIVAIVIVYSLAAAILIEPTVLKYWARFRGVTAGGTAPVRHAPAEPASSEDGG